MKKLIRTASVIIIIALAVFTFVSIRNYFGISARVVIYKPSSNIVPQTCVYENESGKNVIYIVHELQEFFWEEHYVTEVPVVIVNEGKGYYVLNKHIYDYVVLEFSKPFSGGDTVIVAEAKN